MEWIVLESFLSKGDDMHKITCIFSGLPQKTVPSLQWHLSRQEGDPGLWQQLELPDVLSRFLKERAAQPSCLVSLPGSTEPGYRLSSSWHSEASHTSHKLWLDYSQLLSTTNSSQLIFLLMCPTGSQVLGRVGRTYAVRRDAGNA